MHALFCIYYVDVVFLYAWQVTPIVPASYNERQALQAEFKRPFIHAMAKEMLIIFIDTYG